MKNKGLSGVGLTREWEKSFGEKNRSFMDLPSQIIARLDAIGIMATDIDEHFVKGSGPGGQKVNKTSSTVMLRHRPSGIEVRIQKERSQAANREAAWKILCTKLEGKTAAEKQAMRAVVEKNRRRNRTKSRAAKQKMVAEKRRRSQVKSYRGGVTDES